MWLFISVFSIWRLSKYILSLLRMKSSDGCATILVSLHFWCGKLNQDGTVVLFLFIYEHVCKTDMFPLNCERVYPTIYRKNGAQFLWNPQQLRCWIIFNLPIHFCYIIHYVIWCTRKRNNGIDMSMTKAPKHKSNPTSNNNLTIYSIFLTIMK